MRYQMALHQRQLSSRIPTRGGVPYLGREMVTTGFRREQTTGAGYRVGDARTGHPKSDAGGLSEHRHHHGYGQLTTLSQTTYSKPASSTSHYAQTTHYPATASSTQSYVQTTHFPATASSTPHYVQTPYFPATARIIPRYVQATPFPATASSTPRYVQTTNFPAIPALPAAPHLPTENIQLAASKTPQAPGTKQVSETTYASLYTSGTMESLSHTASTKRLRIHVPVTTLMARPGSSFHFSSSYPRLYPFTQTMSHVIQPQVTTRTSEVGGAGLYTGRLPPETLRHWQRPLRTLPPPPPPRMPVHILRRHASQEWQNAPLPLSVEMWPASTTSPSTLQTTAQSEVTTTGESSQALVQRTSNLVSHARPSIPMDTEQSTNVELRRTVARFGHPTTSSILQRLSTLTGSESLSGYPVSAAVASSVRQPLPVSALITCTAHIQVPRGNPLRLSMSEPIVITCSIQRNILQAVPQFITGSSGFTTRMSTPPFGVTRRPTRRRVSSPGEPIFTSPQGSPPEPSASVSTALPGTRQMEEHCYGLRLGAPPGIQPLPITTATPFTTCAQGPEQHIRAQLFAASQGFQPLLSVTSPVTRTQVQQSGTQQLTVPRPGFQDLSYNPASVAVLCTIQTQLQHSETPLDTISTGNLPSQSSLPSATVTCTIQRQGQFAEATFSARQDIGDVTLQPDAGSHSLTSARRISRQFVQQALVSVAEWLPEYSAIHTHTEGIPLYLTQAHMRDQWTPSHSRQAQSTLSAVSTSISIPPRQTEAALGHHQSQQHPSHPPLQTDDHVSQRSHKLGAHGPPLMWPETPEMPEGRMEQLHSSQATEQTQHPQDLQQGSEETRVPTSLAQQEFVSQGTSSYGAPSIGYSSSDYRMVSAGIGTSTSSTTSSSTGHIADDRPGKNVAGKVSEMPIAGPSHTALQSDASTPVDFQLAEGTRITANTGETAGTSAQVDVGAQARGYETAVQNIFMLRSTLANPFMKSHFIKYLLQKLRSCETSGLLNTLMSQESSDSSSVATSRESADLQQRDEAMAGGCEILDITLEVIQRALSSPALRASYTRELEIRPQLPSGAAIVAAPWRDDVKALIEHLLEKRRAANVVVGDSAQQPPEQAPQIATVTGHSMASQTEAAQDLGGGQPPQMAAPPLPCASTQPCSISKETEDKQQLQPAKEDIIEGSVCVSLGSDGYQMSPSTQSGVLEIRAGSPVGIRRDRPEGGGTSEPESLLSVEQQRTEVVPPEPEYSPRRFSHRSSAKQDKKPLERHSWDGNRTSPAPKQQRRWSWPPRTGELRLLLTHLENRQQFKRHDKLKEEEALGGDITTKPSQGSISHVTSATSSKQVSELAQASVEEVESDKKESDSDD